MQSLAAVPSRFLDAKDPLHTHLAVVTLPRAGIEVTHPDFEAICLSNRQAVYLCRERKSHILFVCKFFGSRRHLSEVERRTLLNLEFFNLSAVREMGFSQFPHRVVRPLSKSERINCVLVEEFARGHDLDYYIGKAAYEGQHKCLFQKLTKLAHFLAELHNSTANMERLNFVDASNYFRYLVDMLVQDQVVDAPAADKLRCLCGEWEKADEMGADVSVLVHGDATPTNFFFHPEDGVTAIDLERMHLADRVYDVGMLAAELRHHFAWRVYQADAAEPFISRLLWTYCEDFPDPEAGFRAISARNRFYMALGELRIARNPWLPWGHRKWLADEACRCLQ